MIRIVFTVFYTSYFLRKPSKSGKPKKIYPIHTENAAWFKENFHDIEVI